MWHVPMNWSAWKRMRKTIRDIGEYLYDGRKEKIVYLGIQSRYLVNIN
jgi:hypothetical protein